MISLIASTAGDKHLVICSTENGAEPTASSWFWYVFMGFKIFISNPAVFEICWDLSNICLTTNIIWKFQIYSIYVYSDVVLSIVNQFAYPYSSNVINNFGDIPIITYRAPRAILNVIDTSWSGAHAVTFRRCLMKRCWKIFEERIRLEQLLLVNGIKLHFGFLKI